MWVLFKFISVKTERKSYTDGQIGKITTKRTILSLNLSGIGTLSGLSFVKMVFHPSERGSALARKWGKFLLFRVDLFLEEAWCAGQQTGSHKRYFLLTHAFMPNRLF